MLTLTAMVPRPSWRVASLVAAMLLVLTTCGGAPDSGQSTVTVRPMAAGASLDGDAPAVPPTGATAAEDAGIPTVPPPPDEPADTSPQGPDAEEAADEQGDGDQARSRPRAPAEVPDEVELHEPELVVRASGEPLRSAPQDIRRARHATAVREFTATTPDPDGDAHELELMAVDPAGFRPLTPDVTAQSPAVWERLDEGDVLVRHDIAHELELELGETMELTGDGGTRTVRIGALAANGAPPLADIIVPFEVAAGLGSPGLNAMVLSTRPKVDPERLADDLEALGDVELLRPPEPERTTSQPTSSGSVELEPFTYTSRGDGTIAIHGDWAQRNIVPVDIPGMGTARCHRAMVPQLYAALQEIIDEGIYDHFKPEQFGGCWVPRHILWNPERGLSMHAWGLAIDFNVQDNWFGETPQMDPRIVQIFEKWGFAWGGHWSTPDGMHFELERFVEVP